MADPSNVELSEILKRVYSALTLARLQPKFDQAHVARVTAWAAGYSVAVSRGDPAITRAWYAEGLRLESALRRSELNKLWIAAGLGALVVGAGWLLLRK